MARTPLLPDIEIQARQDRRWGPLRIGSEHISRARLFHADAAAATAPRPSRALARAGSGLRMYGAWRALLSIRDHALHGQYAELGLELGALTALGTAEGIERGLPRLARTSTSTERRTARTGT